MARLAQLADDRPIEAAFFFGTLMVKEILQRVIGHEGAQLTTHDANLVGYTRHHVKRADYPGVVTAEQGLKIMGRPLTDDEASVRGVVVTGLSPADMDLLDEFEGDEYCRDVVSVYRLGQEHSPPMRAWVYLWDSSLSRLAPTLWSYEDFCRDKLSRWVHNSEEYAEVDRRRQMNGQTTPREELPVGHENRQRFWTFETGWTPINHGSYGACPKPVIEAFRGFQDRAEATPDRFLVKEVGGIVDGVRARLAKLVKCEVDDLMMCLNATTAVNAITRSLRWRKDDVILHFSTVYGACFNTIRYVIDSQSNLQLKLLCVPLIYPLSDDQVIEAARHAIEQNPYPGKIRLALFDAITSTPGVRVPWERLCALFRQHGILSLVDGAHAICQIPIHLSAAQPDFFVSNVHKHGYAHRACAVLYVPRRLQRYVHAIPIGHSYHPTPADDEPHVSSTSLLDEWAWTSTQDWSAICSISAALDFREQLGGEERVMRHNHDLAVRGGEAMAKILGTEVLENEEKSLTAAMVNVRLPLKVRSSAETAKLRLHFIDRLVQEYSTYAMLFEHGGHYWTRATGQIYLELSDFEYVARALQQICRDLEA